jgi:hypothetical protein
MDTFWSICLSASHTLGIPCQGIVGLKPTQFNLKLEAISKPIFSVILNTVKDLKLLKIQDSSLRSE